MKPTKQLSESEKLLAQATDEEASSQECEKAAKQLDKDAADLRATRDRHAAKAKALRTQAENTKAPAPAA